MESEKTIAVQRKVDCVLSEVKRLQQTRYRIVQSLHEPRADLEKQRAELPILLADHALGNITIDEVQKVKDSIHEIETVIADSELAIEGLLAMEKPLEPSIRHDRRFLQKVPRYHEIRKDLERDRSDYSISELKNLSEILGFQSDFESFIQDHPHFQ